MRDGEDLFAALSRSRFRSRFHLDEGDFLYLQSKGMETIRRHARDFITRKLAPAFPENDGRQTPMRGHPVFKAQHACACCCRECLAKWHHIPKGRELSGDELSYVVDGILMEWLRKEMERRPAEDAPATHHASPGAGGSACCDGGRQDAPEESSASRARRSGKKGKTPNAAGAGRSLLPGLKR
ncbi:MAG: DUF4186 domain-containing protein [Mailhella sp.]|nr:DUF4186 domain-containing protein [Mailhella sp.]